MTNELKMKIMFVHNLAEARAEMKKLLPPKMAIVFRNLNDKTLAVWAPDGYSSGTFVTRHDVKKNPNINFMHNYNGSQGALEELKHDVFFKKEKRLARCFK